VALVDAEITPPAAGAPPGASGEQCFRFTASRKGRFEIVLERKRVWEAQAAATRRFLVEVR
jgi:predicted secreted protein